MRRWAGHGQRRHHHDRAGSVRRRRAANHARPTLPASIEQIESVDFDGLGLVNEFVLRGSRITVLRTGGFDGLLWLRRLDLSDLGICWVHANVFQGLQRLETLCVSSRCSSTASSSRGLGCVTYLDLSRSTIATIEQSAFEGLGSLEWLY